MLAALLQAWRLKILQAKEKQAQVRGREGGRGIEGGGGRDWEGLGGTGRDREGPGGTGREGGGERIGFWYLRGRLLAFPPCVTFLRLRPVCLFSAEKSCLPLLGLVGLFSADPLAITPEP